MLLHHFITLLRHYTVLLRHYTVLLRHYTMLLWHYISLLPHYIARLCRRIMTLHDLIDLVEPRILRLWHGILHQKHGIDFQGSPDGHGVRRR